MGRGGEEREGRRKRGREGGEREEEREEGRERAQQQPQRFQKEIQIPKLQKTIKVLKFYKGTTYFV